MAIVYLHRRKDCNEVFYVGIGKSEKRAFQRHSRTDFWKNIVSKYGLSIEITHKNITWEEAEHIEQYLISFWRAYSKVKLCNLTDGGEGVKNLKLPDCVIKKRNDAIKAAWNEERKIKYREQFKLEKNPFYGKKHSAETRKKMSENNNPRKKITEEHKNRISISNKGKIRTEETKKKLSEIKKGKPTWNKGVSCKEETKIKLREALKKYHKNKKNEIYHGRETYSTAVCLERLA